MAGFAEADATDAAYAAWLQAHEGAVATPAADARPLFSAILPLGFDRFGPLQDTIASLQAQTYPLWEVCVAGQPHPHDAAAGLQGLGARARSAGLAARPDLATAAAAALGAVTGSHVAFLGVGERLPPHALQAIAAELAAHPQTDLLFTDEDAVDGAGARHSPCFKPGWDPDLLLAWDCVGALAVWSREAIAALGGLRPGFGRASGHDLALRAAETLAPDRIRHLPRVLLHRPMEREQARHERRYGAEPASVRKAVAERLPPGAGLIPAPGWPGANRIIWPLPSPPPLVSVLLTPTGEHWSVLRAAYGVLFHTDYPAIELLVADTGRPRGEMRAAIDSLAARPGVRVVGLPATARSLPEQRNALAAAARGEVLALLDSGCEVIEPGWLTELIGQALRPGVGAAGAQLLGSDGAVRHGGYVAAGEGEWVNRTSQPPGFSFAGELGAAAVRNVAAVSAAAMALPRAAFAELGGFDAGYYSLAGADIDLCLRLRESGYRVLATPFAPLLWRDAGGAPPDKITAQRTARQQSLLWEQWRCTLDDVALGHPALAYAPEQPPGFAARRAPSALAFLSGRRPEATPDRGPS